MNTQRYFVEGERLNIIFSSGNTFFCYLYNHCWKNVQLNKFIEETSFSEALIRFFWNEQSFKKSLETKYENEFTFLRNCTNELS